MLVLAEMSLQILEDFSKYRQRNYVVRASSRTFVRCEMVSDFLSLCLESLAGQATILSELLPHPGCASDRMIFLHLAQSLQAILGAFSFLRSVACAVFVRCCVSHDFRQSTGCLDHVEAREPLAAFAQSERGHECGEAGCRIAEPGPL